jgi:hypothetical protein
MANIQYRGDTYYSNETVVYFHENKWYPGDLTILNDGTIRIIGLLHDLDLVFNVQDLQAGDDIRFDKIDRYRVNPYESDMIRILNKSISR